MNAALARCLDEIERADKIAKRRYERALAEKEAAQPRAYRAYFYMGLGGELIEAIRAWPSSPALCWPIVRALCAYRRLRPDTSWVPPNHIRYDNAAILIRAELRRLAAARADRIPQAAE